MVQGLIDTRSEYDHLFSTYAPIAIGVFLLILVLVRAAVLICRRRPPERPARWHQHNPLEGTYAVLLACVAGFVLYLTFTTEHRVDTVANQAHPSVVIDVTASKWVGTFDYPAYGITEPSGAVGRRPRAPVWRGGTRAHAEPDTRLGSARPCQASHPPRASDDTVGRLRLECQVLHVVPGH